jgi:hypothetical protein
MCDKPLLSGARRRLAKAIHLEIRPAPRAQVHNMTIRAKGKLLLDSTLLTVTAGRRYGLVGPNGMGKSTLLRMIARRQVPVPEGLDVLLVEQARPGPCRSPAREHRAPRRLSVLRLLGCCEAGRSGAVRRVCDCTALVWCRKSAQGACSTTSHKPA